MKYINKQLVILLYIILVASTGFYVLNKTSYLNIFDKYAFDSVEKKIRSELLNKFTIEGKERQVAEKLADEKTKEFLANEQVSEAIKNQAHALKALHKDENGQVYPYRVDSYFFIRKAEYYLKNGKWGVEKDGMQIDPLRYYPYFYTPSEFDMVSYSLVISYKFVNFFHGVNLLTVAFYLPLLFGILSLILIFFISYKVSSNSYIAFISSFFVALNHRFFVGTFAGNVDSQFLFSFMIILIIFLYFHVLDSWKKLFILMMPILLLFYLLKISWSGWIYLAGVIFPHAFFYYTYNIFSGVKSKRFCVIFLIILLFSSTLFLNPQSYFKSYFNNAKHYLFKNHEIINLESTLVSETAKYGFIDFLYALGGYEEIPIRGFFILILVIFSIFLICYKNIRHVDKLEIFIVYWFLLSLFLGLNARRFSLYMAPSMGILIGLGIKQINKTISFWLEKMHIPYDIAVKTAWLIFIPIFIFFLSYEMIQQTNEFIPKMNDAIMNSGNYVKNITSDNTLLLSWWDEGYLWQYAAGRPTFTDGASGGIDYMRNFMFSKALLTKNENVSNNLFSIFSSCVNPIDMFSLISSFTPSIEYNVENRLSIKNPVIERGNAHRDDLGNIKIRYVNDVFLLNEKCPEKEYVLAVSEDMLYKISTFASILKWDTEVEEAKTRIKQHAGNKNEKEVLRDLYNITGDVEADKILKKINSFDKNPEQVSISKIQDCIVDKKSIFCAGVELDIDGKIKNRAFPKSLIFVENGIWKETIFENSVPHALVVFENGDRYSYFFVDYNYSRSTLVKLITGAGIEGLEKVYSVNEPIIINLYKPKINNQ